MTGRSASAGAEPIRAGRFAHAEVDLDGVASRTTPVELSLAAPFGALISALFQGRPYRVSRLSLDYVAPERLGALAMFSAKLSQFREPGEAVVSLLVYRGSRLFVRGEANVLVQVAKALDAGHSTNGKSSAYMNGEPR